MTPNANPHPQLLVFRGRVMDALYRSDQLPIYQDNPLIEALPPLLSQEQAFVALQYLPPYTAADRSLPTHERLHLVQEVLQFFQPLPIHLDLEHRFARLIRSGYRARNPCNHQFWSDVDQRVEAISQAHSPPPRFRSTAHGFTIIGISGVGKSTAVEEILQLYPQVINHSYYRAQDLTLRQIVWLKLDCPFDGSIKGLCLNFFQALDDLLQTDYYQNYAAQGRRTVDELIPAMARVASLHCLGVLVIDEIQNLSEAKSGGRAKMLNFFVGLINTIGLPVVLVGTYKAWSILSGEFRQMRRGAGQGDLLWHPMDADDTWLFFLESLWRYQYLQTPAPLVPNLSYALYDESQGIIDFAVKLYMLAQIRAMTTGLERLNETVIRSVAKDSLRLAAPVLAALKQGDQATLQQYEDVYLVNINPALQQAKAKFYSSQLTAQTNSKPAPNTAKPTPLLQPQSAVEPPLPEIAAAAASQGVAAYQALQQAGLIQPATEFLSLEAES